MSANITVIRKYVTTVKDLSRSRNGAVRLLLLILLLLLESGAGWGGTSARQISRYTA